MDVRAIFTEVLAIAMAIIFFINIFADFSVGIWDNVAEFLIFLILAIYLIRGVLNESRQREELDRLNNGLEAQVAEKTAEVRTALDAEQHARMELEKLNDAKNQFILMTQHNLRVPISSLSHTLRSTRGARGSIAPELQESLDDAQRSINRLMSLADDLLDITTLKPGASILDLKPVSLTAAVEDALAELRVPIEHLALRVEYPKAGSGWPQVSADLPKIRECIFVILDNAVRYNKKDGFIQILIGSDDKAFKLIIENSGLGISAEEHQKIGGALFYRGQEARKAYPIGMGVGLSVVKAIIRAHQGAFRIESAGPGTGARVTVTLPLARPAAS